jgi:hypothetical protein
MAVGGEVVVFDGAQLSRGGSGRGACSLSMRWTPGQWSEEKKKEDIVENRDSPDRSETAK